MEIKQMLSSVDGTQKFIFETEDKQTVEACKLILQRPCSDCIICVSSQIGCQYTCRFCISGYTKFLRNLTPEEIVEQIRLIIEFDNLLDKKLEVTYMGTGEPFSNFEYVNQSIKLVFSQLPQIKKINLSTSIPRVDIPLHRFSILKGRGHFQYSMHFTKDDDRAKYMSKYLPKISDSIHYMNLLSNYIGDTFCINYILFDGVNDSVDDAYRLVEYISKCNAYLKISTYSPVKGSDLYPSKRVDQFVDMVRQQNRNLQIKLFQSKGEDIHAACGHFMWDALF